MQIFKNPAFGEVRIVKGDNNTPWFVGKDIAEILGYESPRSAVSKKVDPEDRGVAKMETPSGVQEMTIINESGLYSLILSSKLPQAKAFKHWVTSEVLPAIRQNGGYMQVKEEDTPESIMARAIIIANATIEKLRSENKDLSFKATHLENVVMCNQCYTTTTIAKELGLTAVELNKYLCEQKIQFQQSGQYNLYADFARMGLAKNRTAEKVDENGNLKVFHPYLVWTERGRVFIHNLVRQHPPHLTNKLAIMFVQPSLFT